ncbi:MAG: phosphoribosyltransferase domain-containing protein [Zetaproteobacteria bacterium]|nr:phosphoribosyltransferase domain-containing protein [Zetaproteobacteria bacterium]
MVASKENKSYTRSIQSGVLQLTLSDGHDRMDELMDFASRENPKRHFSFVSKVLGKHIPVQPLLMREIYDELSDLCALNGDAYVVAMSEMGVGLGAGVADSLSKIHPEYDIYFQHTTRSQLPNKTWLNLDEVHSHAVDHILYEPVAYLRQNIMASTTLVIVDDEITTGRTVFLLATRIMQKIPRIQKIMFVSLVNWLSDENTQKFHALGIQIEFVQLIKGEFTFKKHDDFHTALPSKVDSSISTSICRQDLGRLGLKMPYHLDLPTGYADNLKQDRVVVVGHGEHLYLPFLLAEDLQKKGIDVVFQSTTRSPVLAGDAIKNRICFEVDDDKEHYIYNFPTDRKVLAMSEGDDSLGFHHHLQLCPFKVPL